MLPWKRAKLGRVVKKLVPAFVLALSVGLLVWAMQSNKTALGPIGMFLGTWLISGALLDLAMRTGRGSVQNRLSRLTRLPRSDWGKLVAHSGFGITLMGISGLMAWSVEDIRVAKIGETFHVAGYDITLQEVNQLQGPNYVSTTATMMILQDGAEVAVLHPEKRVYPVQAMPTTEAAIANGFWRDIYMVIGDPQQNGGWAVRSFIKPFANWIWAGSIIMALGGILSLSDRRFRVAAGATKRREASQNHEVAAQ
jgi:cytochrome c-type biogenesis protein CcmF